MLTFVFNKETFLQWRLRDYRRTRRSPWAYSSLQVYKSGPHLKFTDFRDFFFSG
jgi:hypothetical protein